MNNQIINICFAVDDHYIPYLKTALVSLLYNRERKFSYNILVLHSGLSDELRCSLQSIADKEDAVSLSFIDVSAEADKMRCKVGTYLSIAAIYRLILFSEQFAQFDKVLYLDCDIIVEDDVSELFFMPMNGAAVLAAEETGFRQMSFTKKAVFIEGSQSYNIDNYRTDVLHMKYPEHYFNAGVMLLDLVKCREYFTFEQVLKVLHQRSYHYNGQDVLNIVLDGRVQLIDNTWNYQNSVNVFMANRPEIYGDLYRDVKRESPKIIHYVSSFKPRNSEVCLGDRYHFYEHII